MANIFPSSGNVGIGTASPSELLEVVDSSPTIKIKGGASGGQRTSLVLEEQSQNDGERILFRRGQASGTIQDRWQFLVSGAEASTDNGSGSDLRLQSQVNNGGWVERLYVNRSTGQVGVGTASPAYPLDVSGSLRSSGNLVEKVVSFTPTTIGWYRILTSGPERVGGILRIYTPNQYDNTYTDVEVQFAQPAYGITGVFSQTRHMNYNGGVVSQIRGSSNGVDIYISTATSPQAVYVYGYGPGMISFVASPVVGATAGSNPVTLTLGTGLRTTAELAGYFSQSLGVGTNAPAYRLDVYDASNDVVGRFRGVGATVDLVSLGATNGASLRLFPSSGGYGGYVGTYNNNPLHLAANSSVVMTVASTNRVGIGTASPAQKLHVAGRALVEELDVSSGSTGEFRADSTNVRYGSINDSYDAVVFGFGNVGVAIDSNNTSSSNFFSIFKDHYNRSSGTELLRVQEDGNVGIGTSSPSARLHVAGQTVLDGGQTVKVTTLSGDATLDATNHTVLVNTSAGNTVTVTLPSASSHPGREYRIKNKHKGTVVVAGTIDGDATGFRLKMNDAVTLVSDGSGWFAL